MASRRASAPCRSGICARLCPENRLQNACSEFQISLLTGCEESGSRKRFPSVAVQFQGRFDWESIDTGTVIDTPCTPAALRSNGALDIADRTVLSGPARFRGEA